MHQPLAIQRPDGTWAAAVSQGPGGVLARLVGIDGVAPCCCEGCCGTGNQCTHYATLDVPDFPPGHAAMAAVTPFAGRLEGWTRLGTAFDVQVSLRIEESRRQTDGSVRRDTLAADGLHRFRFGPVGMSEEQATEMFGPPAVSDGDRKSGWVPDMIIRQWTYRDGAWWQVDPCGQWYLDNGPWSGDVTGENENFSVSHGLATDFPFPGSGSPPATLRSPVYLQPYRGVSNDGEIFHSPLRVDGVVWGPYGYNPALLLGYWYPPPLLNMTTVEAARIARVGGSASWSEGNAERSLSYSVNHGESMVSHYVRSARNTYSWGTAEETSDRRETYTLIRGDPCASYASLPPNACPPPLPNRIARRCDDENVWVSYDPEDRPSPEHRTFRHDDHTWRATDEPTAEDPISGQQWSTRRCPAIGERCDNPSAPPVYYDPDTRPDETYITFDHGGHKYLATGVPASGVPQAVTWSQDACPPLSGNYYKAYACGSKWPHHPSELVYEHNPAVGAPGDGGVVYSTEGPNDSCEPPNPDSKCRHTTTYIATDEPAAGPPTPGARHADVGCGPRKKVCGPCEDGGPIGPPGGGGTGGVVIRGGDRGGAAPPLTGDAMLDAMGFDPERERRALQQGGECGCSQYTYDG